MQLACRQETADVSGKNLDEVEADIAGRMTDKSLDWYINHIVPVVGRQKLKEKWNKIRKEKRND